MNRPFLDEYLPYLLRRADQVLSAAFYATLNDFGIARSEWRVLAVLNESDQLSILDLTEASLSPQPTVTHAVKRLAKRGFVASTPGKLDKRKRFISITPSGRALTTKLVAEARLQETKALSEAGNLSGLIQQLQELTRQVEQQDPVPPPPLTSTPS